MTKTSAASNGSTASEPDKPEHGLMVLREKEARGLISLACDALSQTSSVIHDLHQALYATARPPKATAATVSRCSTRHWAACAPPSTTC